MWISGLSGSGKTTIASIVRDILGSNSESTVLLDGDELRSALHPMISESDPFSSSTRLALARTYSRLCQLLAAQGHTVIIATISMFHEIHEWNRRNLPNYFEVFLSVDHATLRADDPKGIYKRAATGEASSVAGLDLAVEEPLHPHLRLERRDFSGPDEMALTIVAALSAHRTTASTGDA